MAIRRESLGIKKIIPNKNKKQNEKIKKMGVTSDRMARRMGGIIHNQTQNITTNKYKNIFIKKDVVDYDVVICISSFDRYEKINRMLSQLFTQKSKYTFKVILVNDGSNDDRYEKLKTDFPDILYLKYKIGGGKINYWKTINLMWKIGGSFKTYGIIQLDDDFILCDEFLNLLLDKFFEVKEISNDYMAFSFHLYNFNKDLPIESFWFDKNEIFIDGGMLLDSQFLDLINYELDKIEERVTLKTSSYTWVRLKERIIEFGVKIYRFENSLVWHDGNDDSKLHPNVRSKKRIYTKNFINKNVNYEQ